MKFEANRMTTGIGSLPGTDALKACDLILKYFDIPYWPQLPARAFYESMPQFFEDFPGLVVEKNTLRIDPDVFDAQLEDFYQRILDFERTGDVTGFTISRGYAAGLPAFREYAGDIRTKTAVKGQIIGPVSFGLNIPGRNGKPMIYDEIMRDALVKNLQMKARYQQAVLTALNPNTIIFIDESSLDLIYGPYIGYDDIKAKADLGAILGSIDGRKGIHCCINTDWAFLLEMVEIISFDAYRYSSQFLLYYADIDNFLKRGGIIAWGIVPASKAIFAEDVTSLSRQLEQSFEYLVSMGIDHNTLLKNCLITPVCGLGTTDMEITRRAFELTQGVSNYFKRNYLL